MKITLMITLILSSTLVLSACGGNDVSPPEKGGAGTFTIEALGPSQALRSGASATITIKVTPQNGFQGAVTAELVTPPTGVSAMPVTTTVSGPTTLTLNVLTGTAAGILKLPIKVSGGAVAQTDDAFVVAYRVSTKLLGDSTCTCAFVARHGILSNGSLWLMGETHSTSRGVLNKIDIKTGQVTKFSTLINDTYYDYGAAYYGLASADSMIWTSFNEQMNYRPRFVGLKPQTGELVRVEVGEVGGTITNIVTLPDGRLAFLHHTQLRGSTPLVWSIGLFDPTTSQSQLIPLAENDQFLFELKTSPDGHLWTAQGYDAPALVRFNPTTLDVKRFAIGVKEINQALVLAPAKNGKVWYVDQRANELNILDPADGSIRRFPKLHNVGNLYASGDGMLFVRDGLGGGKTVETITESTDGLSSFELPTLHGSTGAIRGFALSSDGSLGYESDGEAYVLPAN